MMDEQKLKREQELADLRTVLKRPQGMRVLKRLFALSNALGASFANDPYCTAFNEGLRQMGIVILRDAQEAAPELMAELFKPTKNQTEE